jgi:hypothetical protein
MSDVPQGPGWWQASDDKWYPPPRPEMPGEEQQPTAPVTATPSGGYPPTTPSGDYPPQGPATAVQPSGPAPIEQPSGPYGPPVQPPVQGPPMAGATPSPYGGMPTPPPGAGQNRTPLFVALGILGALVFVGLLIILTSGDGDETTTDDPTTTTSSGSNDITIPTTPDDPTDDPPDDPAPPEDGGSLELVEQGFSMSADELSETDLLAYGVVIENPSDQVATSIDITIGFLDASGTVIGSDQQVLNVLSPGATFGIGNSGLEMDGEPVEMQVDVAEPTWESPDDYGEITANGISTSIDDWGAPITNFTAESTYGEQLDGPYAFAIYRNSAGEIIGGDWDIMSFIQANGSSTGEVQSLYTIANIDAAQTEIYIDPGYLS